MYKGIMKGSGSRRGNKSEEAKHIYIYIWNESRSNPGRNKWKRSDIGTAKLVRIQGSPFATRGKVGAAVTNRNGSWKWEGSQEGGQRHEENHGPHPLTAKSWYTAQFRSCYSTFQGGEHRKLVSFSRHSCMYACVCEWNRNNTRFIMPLSEGLWGRQLVAGGSNHFPQLGRFDGVFCVEGKVSIRGREFSILFRPIWRRSYSTIR